MIVEDTLVLTNCELLLYEGCSAFLNSLLSLRHDKLTHRWEEIGQRLGLVLVKGALNTFCPTLSMSGFNTLSFVLFVTGGARSLVSNLKGRFQHGRYPAPAPTKGCRKGHVAR